MKWLYFSLLFPTFIIANALQDAEERDFCISFMGNYGFCANARFTHDYHPFILAKTRDSFSFLEKSLENAGFALSGRIVLCGYQEDAVPHYYMRHDYQGIDDEVSTESEQGWDFALGNLFGFASGYALQDIPDHQDRSSFICEHIAKHRVELFNDKNHLLQKHAFGQAYDELTHMRRRVRQHVTHNDIHGVLEVLHALWKWLYTQAAQDGSGRVIATQNILFSLYYARYLLASKVPIIKLFTGPDITYPIEVLPCQTVQATEGAQRFVQCFVKQLVPVDAKKTAYVLCSFVDGVGKTTLLANVRNWYTYGSAFDCYEHVDNSSSQNALLYEISDTVAILDLPAQISHFLTKPDGSVFVDVLAVPSLSIDYCAWVMQYMHAHAKMLSDALQQLMHQIQEAGPIMYADDDSLMSLYAKNLLLLNREPSAIIAQLDTHLFLYDTSTQRLRVLTPLEKAHSSGLKVIEPELMIFNKGLHIPKGYAAFTEDVIAILQHASIERIVFVDCMGMYPRTSRETIRVNFLIQQACQLFGSLFDYTKSAYQPSTTMHHLYWQMLSHPEKIESNLVTELLLRWGLYELLTICGQEELVHLSLAHVSLMLQGICRHLYDTAADTLYSVVKTKLNLEIFQAYTSVSYCKEFQAVTSFNAHHLIAFSQWLCLYWSSHMEDPYAYGWQALTSSLDMNYLDKKERPRYARLKSGQWVEVLYVFHADCHDPLIIQDISSLLRSHWYTALLRLVDANAPLMPPLTIQQASGDLCYIIRYPLRAADNTPQRNSAWLDTSSSCTSVWKICEGVTYCSTWQGIITSRGPYAYGYQSDSDRGLLITSIVQAWKDHYHQSKRHLYGIATADIIEVLHDILSKRQSAKASRENDRLHNNAQLYTRAAATLDMIMTDPQADIIMRKYLYKDFVAGVVVHEWCTLPLYCSYASTQQLFDDYSAIMPVIPLEFH